MFSKSIVYLHKVKPGADGVTQHGKNDSEVIPPESVNNPDPGDDAQQEDENDEDEEKGREDVDGIAPVAFVCSAHVSYSFGGGCRASAMLCR